jgi:hypothetical protein
MTSRALTALVLMVADLLSACSRTEVGHPAGGQRSAPPVQMEPGGPATAGTGNDTRPGTAGVTGTDETPNRVTSFLEPVGMPMSPSMAVATSWLEALRARDEDALTGLTRYPFEWRNTGVQTCNARQPAATAEQFSPIIGCLLADSSLRRALTEHDRAGIADLAVGHLQDWSRPWREQAPAGAVLVNAFIKRSDMQLDVDLWINHDGVQALWTNIVDGTSQVKLARSWLEALKKRDLRALAEVTSYPFEIRDSGREAGCGKRTAVNQAALASAVKCLFKNDELMQALALRAPFVEAAGEDASIPNWAEGWWQVNEHQGLSEVFAGVSNPLSYSFDIILMVAPNGVRAFWKLGSLESRD